MNSSWLVNPKMRRFFSKGFISLNSLNIKKASTLTFSEALKSPQKVCKEQNNLRPKVLELLSGEIGLNESASPCHVVVEEAGTESQVVEFL